MLRLISFHHGGYRRIFRRILDTLSGHDWVKMEQGGILCINCHSDSESAIDLSSYKKVIYYDVYSDAEIRSRLNRDQHCRTNESLFVVHIKPENLYRFGSEILDRARVLYILDYVPESLEERLHVFNLIHKSLLLRQVGPFLYYYSRIVELLTMTAALPAIPPQLLESLGPKSLVYRVSVLRDRICRKFDLWYFRSRVLALTSVLVHKPCEHSTCKHAVITGWYGTETAGDKAILKELVHVLRQTKPDVKISITSIVPGLSRLTNLEVGLDADILELRKLNYLQLASIDLVVFGGGPLMDSSQLKYIDVLFSWAQRRRIETLVFGCGIGPLKTESGVRRIKRILRNTRKAFFRDEHSVVNAKQLGYKGLLLQACDPAMSYVVRWQKHNRAAVKPRNNDNLVILLRAQTSEYSESDNLESNLLREVVVNFISNYLDKSRSNKVYLLPMHTFWLGNDDREYISTIAERLSGQDRLYAYARPLLLDSLLERIATASLGIPMRYHGHIFMLALNIPFVSINYTGSEGKISGLMKRYELTEYSISIEGGIKLAELSDKWEAVQSQVSLIRAHTEKKVITDLRELESTYNILFGKVSHRESG